MQRIRNSAAYRTGPVAQAVVRSLPRGRFAPRPAADFALLTQCGARHLSLLNECLRSVASTWRHVPALSVVADGTISIERVQAALRWWPASISVSSRETIVIEAERNGQDALASFARRSPFGLKFAAIVLSARRTATLFCDADVLWCRDFSDTVSRAVAGGGPLAFCTVHDYQPAYDEELVRAFELPIAEAPFLNSGVVLLRGDLLAEVDLTRLLVAASRRSNHFTEQTLFAVAARELGASAWDQSVIRCSPEGATSLGVTYRHGGWVARHYVGPVRHLFWRDALALRLGVAALAAA